MEFEKAEPDELALPYFLKKLWTGKTSNFSPPFLNYLAGFALPSRFFTTPFFLKQRM
jgi:hypothetical protein